MAQEVPLRCGHKITVEGSLKMRDYRAWVAAESKNDLLIVYGYLAKLVRSWDFEGLDPSDPESYDELEMPEYTQVVIAASEYLLGAMTSKN